MKFGLQGFRYHVRSFEHSSAVVGTSTLIEGGGRKLLAWTLASEPIHNIHVVFARKLLLCQSLNFLNISRN